MSDLPPQEMPSQVLVQRARAQDAKAITALYERYRVPLRNALRRRLGDDYRRLLLDSDDAVHDGILAALHDIDRFEYRGRGSFLAWLLRICEHEVCHRLREHRAAKRDPGNLRSFDSAGEPPAAGASPSELAQCNETERRIERCLERLDPREREAIILRRYFDMKAEEIREEMQLPSAGAARALSSRALAKLAALLDGPDRP